MRSIFDKSQSLRTTPWIKESPLFVSGEDGCHTYRIPALAVTTRGTLFALCEGRKHGRSDAGEIDLLLKRSFDRRRDPYHSHIIYSDDHGATWQIGGVVDIGTNECTVAELEDGSLYINCRNYVGGKRRAVARSVDEGQAFGPLEWDDTLVEPICQASLEQLADGQLLFANPASTERERLTVRLSPDGGHSWPVGRILHPGPSAYSDLAVLPDGSICCLYERGDSHPYETLTLARFSLPWLTEAAG